MISRRALCLLTLCATLVVGGVLLGVALGGRRSSGDPGGQLYRTIVDPMNAVLPEGVTNILIEHSDAPVVSCSGGSGFGYIQVVMTLWVEPALNSWILREVDSSLKRMHWRLDSLSQSLQGDDAHWSKRISSSRIGQLDLTNNFHPSTPNEWIFTGTAKPYGRLAPCP